MMKWILFFVLFFLSTQIFAIETIYLGIGGEPAGPTTAFDESLHYFAMAKKDIAMNLTMSVDGGHAATEKIVKDEVNINNTPFSAASFHNLVDSYLKKMESGQFDGKSILIIIDSHGAQKSGNQKLAHSIATNDGEIRDYRSLNSEFTVDLGELAKLTDLAKKRNVKLGIIDFSCHSGSTLELANSNTCVISASGPNHFSFSKFSNNFFKAMKPKANLETIFLNSLESYDLPTFPMISTRAGTSLQTEFYGLIGPYLNIAGIQNNLAFDHFLPPLTDALVNDKQCERENQFTELLALLENAKKFLPASEFTELVNELVNMKKYQDSIMQKLSQMGFKEKDREEEVSYHAASGIVREKISWDLIINAYPASNLKDYKIRRKKISSKSEREFIDGAIEKYEKVMALRKTILAKYPELSSIRSFTDSLYKHNEIILEKTKEIALRFSKLYLKKYKSFSTFRSEVCRDFVL